MRIGFDRRAELAPQRLGGFPHARAQLLPDRFGAFLAGFHQKRQRRNQRARHAAVTVAMSISKSSDSVENPIRHPYRIIDPARHRCRGESERTVSAGAARPVGQKGPVEGNDLRGVGHRVFGQAGGLAGINVFPGASAQTRLPVNGTQTTVANGSGSVDCPEQRPPVGAIRGQTRGSGNSAHQTSPCRIYHSARSNARRATTASDGSGRGSPSRSTTRFIASVTSSGHVAPGIRPGLRHRAGAGFPRPLRLSLRGEKRSSGREIAVFIPKV